MIYKLEHVDYEITKACNLKCIHCSARAGKGKKPDLDLIKEVLKDTNSLGLKRVGITGGEPFLFPKELSDLINFSVDVLNCSVHIHTNGTLLRDGWNILACYLKRIENLTIPLLGNEETHDLNCGVEGVYERIKNSAELLSDYSIPTTIFVIPLSNNFKNLSEAIRDFYNLGMRKFRVMRLSPGGRARENYDRLRLSKEQMEFFDEQSKNLERELGIKFEAGFCTRLTYPCLGSLMYHDSCMSGINRLHINADGFVFPCTAASGFKELSIGDINQQGLEAIWQNSERLREIRGNCFNGCKTIKHYEETT